MARRLTCFIAIISGISLACTSGAQTNESAAEDTAGDTTEQASLAPITQQEIEQNTQQFSNALRTGNANALPDRFADDGVLISASGKLDGGDAIRTFWADAAKAGKSTEHQVKIEKFGADEKMAYVLSRFTGGVTAAGGYTLQVWQRGADGQPRIVAQVSMPDAVIKKN